MTREASVQFAAPLLFRVIRVHDWSTYDGWAWLDGYELNSAGEAVDRRSIFVQIGGLQHATPALNGRLGLPPTQASRMADRIRRPGVPVGAAPRN